MCPHPTTPVIYAPHRSYVPFVEAGCEVIKQRETPRPHAEMFKGHLTSLTQLHGTRVTEPGQ